MDWFLFYRDLRHEKVEGFENAKLAGNAKASGIHLKPSEVLPKT